MPQDQIPVLFIDISDLSVAHAVLFCGLFIGQTQKQKIVHDGAVALGALADHPFKDCFLDLGAADIIRDFSHAFTRPDPPQWGQDLVPALLLAFFTRFLVVLV